MFKKDLLLSRPTEKPERENMGMMGIKILGVLVILKILVSLVKVLPLVIGKVN